MIVPMKKVSLIIKGDKKTETLTQLRKLGIVHIEITEGSGERIGELQTRIALLKSTIYTMGRWKKVAQQDLSTDGALSVATEMASLAEEKKQWEAERVALTTELDRLKNWGEIAPQEVRDLAAKGVTLSFYEMPKAAYAKLPDEIQPVKLATSKSSVQFMLRGTDASLAGYQFILPQYSTAELKEKLSEINARIDGIQTRMASCLCYGASLQKAVDALEKEVEFEIYATGMASENLSQGHRPAVSVAYFKGYIEADNLEQLKQAAARHSWGLLVEDPCHEDHVPTKLKNNKFVSLVYPLIDFLGTVPGYFEYDISGWFLAFILIFFGIIFGDGGYGLLICGIAAIPIVKALVTKKKVSPTFLLVGLFGLATVVWGTLTCTWFGLPPDRLPNWLQHLSVPVISNVYADKIWQPPWTSDGVGLTTSQNVQIFCFTLALVQLTVAHVKGAIRNKGSVKMLGDLGSILQLLGIYYLVLSLVVNSAVFSFGLVIGGIPVGTVAVVLIGIGFALSFVFSNYAGSLIKSILASLQNIVSVLLGVVNVFSDIVSYIRLWAVGLAGAAIAATVNELAGPLFGNFLFMIFAIVLLVFGHGLNMILNVLSVIVHGIRLNTLEFSSHLDMSWSGRKFKPFNEQNNDKGELL